MRPFVLIPLLFAAPVWADCPVGSDLETGIIFTSEIGEREVFTAQANGVVQQDIAGQSNTTYRTLLGQGVHVIQFSDLTDGTLNFDSIVNTAYPVNASDLPIPEPGARFDFDTTVNAYGDFYAETQTQRWGNPISYTTGSCTFTALPGKIQYTSDGFIITEDVLYLPDLGLSLLVGYQDSESDKEIYRYVNAEAAR